MVVMPASVELRSEVVLTSPIVENVEFIKAYRKSVALFAMSCSSGRTVARLSVIAVIS